jgi:hypothetical protein
MKRKLTIVIAGICSLLVVPSTESKAQITLLNDYQNTSSAAIGTFQGINFREAGFSGLFPIPNTNGTEFWTLSDRGVNVDAANANPAGCTPTYDKIYGFPGYAPKIHRVRINGTSLQILQTITMKRPNGTAATGVLNPTGFGSTALEEASTDTVLDCANFSSKIAAKDIWGIDSEGILVDKDGNFWICEEGGPTIWKLNSSGIVIKRYTPYANLPGAQPQDVLIDTVFKYRKNNRGFESITMAPNGKIYALIQSPLLFPNKSTGEGSRIHRILEINPATNATRMLVYLNDGIIGTGGNQIRLRDWKVGDMAAINDSTFLVLEAAARGTSDIKRVYMININGATTVNSGLYSGVTLEALIDSTGLANNSVKAVKKTLFMDLLANGWPATLDKAEGIAIINDSTIAICNDNDYGQSSPAENGVATASSNLSHLITFRLQGANKLQNVVKYTTALSQGQTGISSSQNPYLIPVKQDAIFSSILTAGDSTSNGYKMAGTPDGLGAFDNGNGTFTLVMNHEFGNTAGGIRAHGSKGAFVSKWVINKNDLSVVSGADLIQNVKLWNGTSYTTFNAGNPSPLAAFNRFCSADLPAVSAYFNSATGLGTQARIFMNGEEAGDNGRMLAHIVTGTEAGTTYELPHLGKFSAENLVASPTPQDKTIVAGMDDSTPGQVYIYVGTKTNSGTEVDKAGLTNGKLYGIAVTGLITETSASIPAPNTAFTLVDLGNIRDSSGTYINTRSNTLGVTTFLRPEDGAWDPSNPKDFYFATTNAIAAPSRLWRLRFNNIATPETGGTITAVLDGTEGQKMLDNLTIDSSGHILLVEDVGSNIHDGKVWQYNIATDVFTQIAQHDSSRFVTAGAGFLTQDEEASGILDVQSILGAGKFLLVDQAHYPVAGDQVEGGQLLTLFNPDSYNATLGALPSSSQTPYLVPAPGASGIVFNSILTAGDNVGNYKMAGTPDGLGAFDNGNGTFTLLMNHEFGNTAGVARAHGSAGAFVSKWVINKSNLAVISGADLIQNVKLWNGTSYTTYNAGNPSPLAAFNRFCSADLPAVSAYFNTTSGLGSLARIFMNGEEAGDNGRMLAHIVTGVEAGTTYELPHLGKFSAENLVASPTPQDKTIVAGMDDSTPGQVYIYVGTKTNSGTEVDKAGLTNGKLYGIAVTGLITETSASIPAPNTAFTLVDIGNIRDSSGTYINTRSNTLGVTTFLRPEDGAWDPSNPADFYFATTNAIAAPSRLWRLRFNNIATPETGGTITAVLDGTEGQKMLDNFTIDNSGHILLVEDVGNNVHIGKVWQYNIATDAFTMVGQHDSTRFLSGAPKFLTQDEEASGILDVQSILGAGKFLIVDQAHYAVAGAQVEGGQLLSMYNPDSYNSNPEISLQGNSINIADEDLNPATADNTDFGNLAISVGQSKTFTIQNAGPGSLKVGSITFTGINANEFELTGSPVFPMTIAAAGSQTVTVKLTPSTAGMHNAVMHIFNNDLSEGSFDIGIQGNVVSGEINIEGNSISIPDGDVIPTTGDNTDFGSISNGSSANKTFIIRNNGGDTLRLTAITVTGTNASEYTLQGAPAFPVKLAANATQNITVKFAPTAAGNRTATINIASNDNDEATFDFAVQGTSLVPSIGVQGNSLNIADGDNTPITPDNTDFGNIEKGSTETKTFEIKNSGLADLTVTGINFTGTNAAEFTLVSAPTFPLNVGAHLSHIITVQFAPLETGTRTAAINIANSDQNKATYDFTLQGKGTIPTGIASASVVSFVKLYPNPTGDVTTLAMTLKNKEHITISVTDLQGKEVMLPLERELQAGEQNITINTAALHNGIYSVHISSGSKTTQLKLTVLR